MNIGDAAALLDLVKTHRTTVLVGAGLILAALTAAGWWARKYGRNGKVYDHAAVAVAIALSAEGMWEVATERMGFGPGKALLLFAFAELAMLRAARRARGKVDAGKRPGIYGTMVWSIAIAAGLIAGLNAPSASEFLVRALAPSLVAAQWFADLVDELREKEGVEHQASAWIWTPRRVGIQLGLLKPGAGDDLKEVLRQRNIDRMVRTARRMLASKPARAQRLAARLQRLGESMDETSMATVVERFQRGERVQEVLFGRRVVEVEGRLTQAGDAPDAPVTQPGDAPVTQAVTHGVTHPDAPPTHPTDAPAPQPVDAVRQMALPAVTHLTRRIDAPVRRRGETVMTRPTEPTEPVDDADRDARIKAAADAVMTQGVAQRAAARDAGLPETAVRREVTRRREAAQRINGHSHDLAATK